MTQEGQRAESGAEPLHLGEPERCPGSPRLQVKNQGWRWCSPRHLCVCLPSRRAFQQFYKQFVEYTCPTEDIYLE